MLCAANTLLAEEDDDPPPPTAVEILKQVAHALPKEPLEVLGTMTVRKKRATVINKHRYWMKLDWGAQPPQAAYAVMDMSGVRVARMDMVRRGVEMDFTFYTGTATTPTNTPSLTSRVQGTDITWLDLSLEFLWWPGAKKFGEDRYKGMTCDVLIIPAPKDTPNCSAVKVWIARKQRAMVKAEQMNARGTVTRSMTVESIMKRNDRWMIKELEIRSYPGDLRTILRVKDVSTTGL